MSGLFSKRYVEQQEFQEGEVPDDDHHSDQPAPVPIVTKPPTIDSKKTKPEDEEFIFETVPDNELEAGYLQRDKPCYKGQDYYQQNGGQRKDWERNPNERDKITEKSGTHKIQNKKQTQVFQTKRKLSPPQQDIQIRPNVPPQIPSQPLAYYPNMPPVVNPYTPPGFYPPYGPPQSGVRHPYSMYPPQLHHQAPPGMYVPPPQGPYPVSNPHLYQIPPPMPYASVPMVQPIPELYRMDRPQMMDNRPMPQKTKQFGYEQQPQMAQMAPIGRNYQQNPYNQQKPPIQPQRQMQIRQDPRQQIENRQKSQQPNRYPEERQRSRQRKDFYDYENTISDKKQKYPQKIPYQTRNNYDSSYKQKKDNSQYTSSQQVQKRTIKEHKKSQQEESKIKLKKDINEHLKVLFGTDLQEKQDFLFILRDILKHRLLKRQQQEINKFSGFQIAKPVPIYTLSKDLIDSNYEKALLKLQNFIVTLAQKQKITNSEDCVSKRESLFSVLSSLQLEDLMTKIKEMRLKKKLIGERKMSEIKKLLEELVKDPRKRVK